MLHESSPSSILLNLVDDHFVWGAKIWFDGKFRFILNQMSINLKKGYETLLKLCFAEFDSVFFVEHWSVIRLIFIFDHNFWCINEKNDNSVTYAFLQQIIVISSKQPVIQLYFIIGIESLMSYKILWRSITSNI